MWRSFEPHARIEGLDIRSGLVPERQRLAGLRVNHLGNAVGIDATVGKEYICIAVGSINPR